MQLKGKTPLVLLFTLLIPAFGTSKIQNASYNPSPKETVIRLTKKDTLGAKEMSYIQKMKTINSIKEKHPEVDFIATVNKSNAEIFSKSNANSDIVIKIDSGSIVKVTGISEFNVTKFTLVESNNSIGWTSIENLILSSYSEALLGYDDNFFYNNIKQNRYNDQENSELQKILNPSFDQRIKKLKQNEVTLAELEKESSLKLQKITKRKEIKKIESEHEIKKNILIKYQTDQYNLLSENLKNSDQIEITKLNTSVNRRIESERKSELDFAKKEQLEINRKTDSINQIQIKREIEKHEQDREIEKAHEIEKEKNRKKSIISRYGEKNGNLILQEKIWIGMTEEMLLESLGKPQRINTTETAAQIRKQYVFIGRYVYTEKGIVTTIQSR